jgi:hypothetical protein
LLAHTVTEDSRRFAHAGRRVVGSGESVIAGESAVWVIWETGRVAMFGELAI